MKPPSPISDCNERRISETPLKRRSQWKRLRLRRGIRTKTWRRC